MLTVIKIVSWSNTTTSRAFHVSSRCFGLEITIFPDHSISKVVVSRRDATGGVS
jgi:hypothetical protein